MQTYQIFERYCELQCYIGWTEEDAQRVLSLAPIVQRYFHALVDDFYEAIKQNPFTSKVITGGEQQISRLKGKLVNWLEELFSGNYDRNYVYRRWQVGLRHVEIGLEQVYTNAALSRLRNGLWEALQSDGLDADPRVIAARGSVNKLIDLDLSMIEEAYVTEYHRRQQLNERLATIGQVAGGVAHELRNPLNVIRTSVYFLLNARSPSPDKIVAHLERIDRQATVADSVIAALNNFARLPIPDLQSVSALTLIREVLETNSLPENIESELDFPDHLPPIMADPQQLSIVLTNLIRNARDAMSAGGKLKITGRSVGAMVEIEVSDTGVGIPQEILGRIMEPLYSTKARGIGLGLAISRAIVDKHQGELAVRSEVGVGSSFVLRMSAAKSA